MPERENGRAREQAAALVGVGGRYVQEAKRLQIYLLAGCASSKRIPNAF